MLPQKQNAPFLLGPEDAQKACLLIHGFSGTAQEMCGLGEALAERGMRVYGVAVAGHSGFPEDLARSTYSEWLASAELGLAKLAAYPQVYVAGLSMGGMLGLMLAAHHPQQVAGLAILSTPSRFARSWRVLLARTFFKWLYPYSRLDFRTQRARQIYLTSLASTGPHTIDFDDPQVVAEIQATRLSMNALAELAHLLAVGRGQIRKVRCPLLVIHSKFDKAVNPACAEEILRLATATPSKSLHWLYHSNHVITTGPEREEVFHLVADFMS